MEAQRETMTRGHWARRCIGTALALTACSLWASDIGDDADRLLGVWATDKAKAHVEISRDDSGYYGAITWLKEPFYPEGDPEGMAGRAKVDRENPDAALRERNILGLRIMQGFRYVGDDRWEDGTIYDPENGKTYRCKIGLTEEGLLKVRGYVGIPLFGRTSEWTRVLVSSRPYPEVRSTGTGQEGASE